MALSALGWYQKGTSVNYELQYFLISFLFVYKATYFYSFDLLKFEVQSPAI